MKINDQEIEACVRMKYKGKNVSQETIDRDIADMKELRDKSKTIKNEGTDKEYHFGGRTADSVQLL